MSNDEKIDKILGHVEKLSRGMYGDPDNGTLGLIKENKDQELRILKLEQNEKKRTYWIAGMSFAAPAILYFIKEKLGL